MENVLNHPTFFAGNPFLDDDRFGGIAGAVTSPFRVELLFRWSF